jgi:CRP/FNR family transcriptional regulator/CRP/FNR family cyclic AMP-dependent transcriptional regulator
MIETIQALKKVPLFTNLTDAELKLLSSASSVKTFVKNQTIIHKSDEGDTFFSILAGKVKVVLTDEEGREYIVGILKQNEFFGELALLDGEPRSATVVAMMRTDVLVLKREDFLSQMTTNPEMCIKILGVLGVRLRKANQHIESLVFLDVCGRLARMLLDMAETQGRETGEGIIVEVEHSRTDLANLIGTTRETLTRALKTLENMGYIDIRKNQFLIMNAAGLRGRMY